MYTIWNIKLRLRRYLKHRLIRYLTQDEIQRYMIAKRDVIDKDSTHYHRIDGAYILLRFIRGEKTE